MGLSLFERPLWFNFFIIIEKEVRCVPLGVKNDGDMTVSIRMGENLPWLCYQYFIDTDQFPGNHGLNDSSEDWTTITQPTLTGNRPLLVSTITKTEAVSRAWPPGLLSWTFRWSCEKQVRNKMLYQTTGTHFNLPGHNIDHMTFYPG